MDKIELKNKIKQCYNTIDNTLNEILKVIDKQKIQYRLSSVEHKALELLNKNFTLLLNNNDILYKNNDTIIYDILEY